MCISAAMYSLVDLFCILDFVSIDVWRMDLEDFQYLICHHNLSFNVDCLILSLRVNSESSFVILDQRFLVSYW